MEVFTFLLELVSLVKVFRLVYLDRNKKNLGVQSVDISRQMYNILSIYWHGQCVCDALLAFALVCKDIHCV